MIKILQFLAQQQNAYRSTTAFFKRFNSEKIGRQFKQIADAIGLTLLLFAEISHILVN